MISNGIVSFQQLLKCDHEEADDQLLFHANHAIKVDNFKKVIVASPDTDVLVNVIYNFSRWIFSDLEEMWIIGGNRGSQKAIHIHSLVKQLDAGIVEVLSALHALRGTISNSYVVQRLFMDIKYWKKIHSF